MALRGWFPLWLSFFEGSIYAEGTLAELKLALWLMGHAQRKPGGDPPRGCVDIHRTDLARRAHLDEKRARIALSRLEHEHSFVAVQRLGGHNAPIRIRIRKFDKWRGALAGQPIVGDEHDELLDAILAEGTDVRPVPECLGETPSQGPGETPSHDRAKRPVTGVVGGRNARAKRPEVPGETPSHTLEGRSKKIDLSTSHPSGAPSDVDLGRFEDQFSELFSIHNEGALPTWDARHRKQVKTLLARHPVGECMRRARIMFEHERAFPPPPYDLPAFVAHFDKFASAPNGRNGRKTAPIPEDL